MKKNLLLAFAILLSNISVAQLIPGLIAKYSFNNASTNDEVGINHLTPQNGATLGADRFGNPYHSSLLDGANDYLNTTTPFFYPGQAFTISLWFKSNNANQSPQTFFNTNPHQQVTIGYNYYGDGTFDAGLSNGAGWNIGTTAPNGLDTFRINGTVVTNWNHYVLTYDGTTWNYYMNNTLVNSTTGGTPSNVISDLYFGAISVGPQSFFNGLLDDIAVFDRAITVTEIGFLNNEPNPVAPGLIAKYSFDNANTNDDIGINHLSPQNGATLGVDRFGNTNHSSLLDGANDYLKTTTPFFYPGQAYSISLWFKSNNANQSPQTFFNTNPHQQVTVGYNYYGDGTFDAGLSNGAGWNIGTTAPNGLDTFRINGTVVTNWNHFVLTYDGSVWNYYMNNILVNSTTGGTPSNTISDLYFGAISAGPQSFFNGSIDDIFIFDRVITIPEIGNFFNAPDPATIGIKENITYKNNISIYPNPVNSSLTINVSEPSSIAVIDMLGKELVKINIQGKETINVTSLENGIYFIKDILSGKAVKFIKQ